MNQIATYRATAKSAVCVWIVILAAGLSLAANTYYVSTNGNDGAAGTSWATAFLTISNGVAKATTAGSGSEVILSNGVHYLTTQVVVSAAITVHGMTTNRDQVVVNGNFPVRTNRCFYLSSGAVIADLTITNGFARTDTVLASADGGGVYIANATLRNCLITGNTSTNSGGGVYANSSGCYVTNCTIAGNVASNGNGGGIYIYTYGGLYNSIISNNLASLGQGGGVYGLAAPPMIQGCQIVANRCSARGGGVSMGGGTVTNCLIQNNVTTGSGGQGAGVYLNLGVVVDCRIIGNSAGLASGGGVYMWQNNGQLFLNCQMISNVAPSGGGAYLGTCNGTLRNCLIAGNTATDHGGGVWQWGFSPSYIGKLVNCTVVDNVASNRTGGVECFSDGININCVIYGNRLVNGTGTNWFNTTTSGVSYTNCCTVPTNGLPGTGNIEADPLFVNPAVGNYRLQGRSRGVNTGLFDAWMTSATDLVGQPRIRYDRVDIGCYETLYQGIVLELK